MRRSFKIGRKIFFSNLFIMFTKFIFLSVIYSKCTEHRRNLCAEFRVIAKIIQDCVFSLDLNSAP